MSNKKLLKMMDDIITDMKSKTSEELFNEFYSNSENFINQKRNRKRMRKGYRKKICLFFKYL